MGVLEQSFLSATVSIWEVFSVLVTSHEKKKENLPTIELTFPEQNIYWFLLPTTDKININFPIIPSTP